LGGDLPPAPIFPAIVTPPDWADSVIRYPVEGFLDTGSDCTLVPLEIISLLELKIIKRSVSIAGVGGSTMVGFPCYLNIYIEDNPIKAIRAYGCSWEGLQHRILFGRDAMNMCTIHLDGKHSQLTIEPLGE
jgi:hypothetical protein